MTEEKLEHSLECRTRDGEIVSATFSVTNWKQWIEELEWEAPLLEEIRLVDVKGNPPFDLTPLSGCEKFEALIITSQNLEYDDLKDSKFPSNLRKLDLSHNQLSDIPDLWDFRDLQSLSLSHNQLSLSTVYRRIFHWGQRPPIKGYDVELRLKYLDLSYNRLEERCSDTCRAEPDWNQIVESHLFGHLVVLNVSGNKGIDELKRYLYDMHYVWDGGELWSLGRHSPADSPERILCHNTDLGAEHEITREEYVASFEK